MPLGYAILIAYALDLLIGDPLWLPHPVRAMAGLAQAGENFWRATLCNQKLAGVMTVISVLGGVGATVFALLTLAKSAHPLAGDWLTIYLLYSSLATRDLARHSRGVYKALAACDLVLARQQVAMIVGRETANLTEAEVSRACVESVAENIVDGITAPLFWAALFGPIGAMLYKSINTMDSMFGYKNERYRVFGWAPAHLDDLANYLPARLTAVLVIIAAAFLGRSPRHAFLTWRRDRRNHASPNSAQTEAAVAGALGIQLGGPASYFGCVIDKPTIGDAITPITPQHILSTNQLMLLTTGLAVLLAALAS
ncbi:MAG: adenosylcobinamide-phosphate synthase CbiB [Desulfobulbaceae bacterium]|nr:adenosylcobinamide-phosphate synthase CbiB [Desulfobulbaceae bacterium]